MLQKLNDKKQGGFTLVEIMIVVAIIALLAAIAVPSFLRARERSQATTVLNELRLVDAAKDQYLIENNLTDASFNGDMIAPYLKPGSELYNNALGSGTTIPAGAAGATITINDAATLPSVDALAVFDTDVVPAEFWSPYGATGS